LGRHRTTLTAFWYETGEPIFNTVKGWLEVNLPIAIQVLSDFWTNTLKPAMETVWTFITDKVIPILVTLVTDQFEKVKAAIKVVSDYWTNTLKPALSAVWSFLDTYVIPVFKALVNVGLAIVQRAVEELVKVWNETFKPALIAVRDFIEGYLMPTVKHLMNAAITPLADAAKSTGNTFNNTFRPALEAVSSFISATAAPAMNAISSAISAIGNAVSSAIGWLNKLADAIRGVPSMPSLGGGGGSVPGFASGTSYAPGGMAWVGERGPELVNLPRGSQVHTASQSQRMAGGGHTYNITYHGTNSQDERSVRDDIRYLQMLQG
jgi:phage-related protein